MAQGSERWHLDGHVSASRTKNDAKCANLSRKWNIQEAIAPVYPKFDEGGTSSKVGDAEGNCNTNLERLDLDGRQARNLCRSYRSRDVFLAIWRRTRTAPISSLSISGHQVRLLSGLLSGQREGRDLSDEFQQPLLKAGHPDVSRQGRNQIPWLAQPSDIGLECDASERNRSLVGSVSVQRRGRRPVSLPNVR